jgi:CubicO group peptidase (beta-lactamase class C family)
MVDIEDKAGADAIASAWKLAVPGFNRNPDDTVSPPITDGWDSVTRISYEVAAAESRAIAALSRTKDEIAYVLLIDGPMPTLRRRGAQLTQIIGSQRAHGMKEESFAGKRAKPVDEAIAANLDAFIEDARRKTRVPGAAVSVIQGGKTVFERGYGTRRLGGAEKVTPDTAFLIGSTTKPLTSLMMAVLVERGLFGWSTPLRDVLPTFSLADPELSGKIEMQHSVCACTGLPRQDMELIFEFSDLSPDKRLAELATMKPTTAFGETFQYSNALVSAGGYAAAHARWPHKALRDAYVETMKETLFEPMGMRSTTFSGPGAAPENHATPHGLHLAGNY